MREDALLLYGFATRLEQELFEKLISVSGIGPNDRVQINVSVTGNSARIDSEHHSAPDNKGELAGRITSIDLAGTSLISGFVWTRFMPELIEAGYARPYHGEKREGWCP